MKPLRERYEERSKEFYKRYYRQLVGARIIGFEGVNKDPDLNWEPGFPCFKVQFADGRYGLIEISRDEEGNGGGFIFGLSLPSMDDFDKKHKLNRFEEAKA